MKMMKRIILLSGAIRERLRVSCAKGEMWPYHFASVRSVASGNMFSILDIPMIRIRSIDAQNVNLVK